MSGLQGAGEGGAAPLPLGARRATATALHISGHGGSRKSNNGINDKPSNNTNSEGCSGCGRGGSVFAGTGQRLAATLAKAATMASPVDTIVAKVQALSASAEELQKMCSSPTREQLCDSFKSNVNAAPQLALAFRLPEHTAALVLLL